MKGVKTFESQKGVPYLTLKVIEKINSRTFGEWVTFVNPFYLASQMGYTLWTHTHASSQV